MNTSPSSPHAFVSDWLTQHSRRRAEDHDILQAVIVHTLASAQRPFNDAEMRAIVSDLENRWPKYFLAERIERTPPPPPKPRKFTPPPGSGVYYGARNDRKKKRSA